MTSDWLRQRYYRWRRHRLQAAPSRWPNLLTGLGIVLLLMGAALMTVYVLRLH